MAGARDTDCDLSGLGVSFGALNVASTQITPREQYTASSFCDHIPMGFGYLPMLTRFDPTKLIRNDADSLSTLLIPTTEEINAAKPLRISGETPGFQCRREIESLGVTAITLKALENFGLFVDNGRKTFSSRHLSLGIAKDSSYNDIDIRYRNIYSTVLENKGAESSVIPALAQGAATGTNFVLHMANSGVPFEKCAVCVIANTGMNICFGATILLSDSFPTYIPLSKNLDLLDDRESRIAGAYLSKCVDHARRLGNIPLERPKKPFTEMTLNLENYFVKKLTRLAFDRGLGLFSQSGDIFDIQDGLNHMIWCLNRLYYSEARDVPEYPLSVRTPNSYDDEGEINFFELIYRNLSALGYRTGTPDRIEHPDLYASFVRELQRVMALVHQAGVLHLDLYASNIMWKLNDTIDDVNAVVLKIVDWDVSHCIEEADYCPNIKRLLKNRVYANRSVEFGVNHDERYLQVYNMKISVDSIDHWHALASGNKHDIDSAFQTLMTELFSV